MTTSGAQRAWTILPAIMLLQTVVLFPWAAHTLAEPAHPPLVPEGEVIPNLMEVVDDILPRTGIEAVAYSPDGKLLASGWGDGAVRLWDPATGKLLRTLEGHGHKILGVAFSPDGNLLASASWDQTVRLWNPATGKHLRTLEGPERMASVAFSPDGRQLAAGIMVSEGVRLWDPATGEHLNTLEGKGHIDSLSYSTVGTMLASGSDRDARLWNPTTGEHLRTLEVAASGIAFSPDGELLATSGGDLRLWNPATGEHLRTLEGHTHNITSVAFSPDGRLLASGSVDSTVRLWDPTTGENLRTLKGHAHQVTSVTFSPDGRLLASTSGSRIGGQYRGDDGDVRIWDIATGEILHTWQGHGRPVGHGQPRKPIAFSPDGKLAALSSDGTLRLWDLGAGPKGSRKMRILLPPSEGLRSFAFSPDWRVLASGYYEKNEKNPGLSKQGILRLWDTQTGEILHTLEAHRDVVSSVAVSPDGRLLASCSSGEGAVRLWDRKTGRLLRTLKGHRWVVNVSFSPDGRYLASAGDSHDNTLRLWDPITGKNLHTLVNHGSSLEGGSLESPISSFAFSRDGQLLAVASWGGTIRLWDPDSGERLRTFEPWVGLLWNIAFSPDGQLLASGSDDGTVHLWDPATGKLLHTLEGHRSYVSGVAFSLDGRLLASGSKDRTIRLWDPKTGAALGILFGSKDGLWAACRIPEEHCWRYDDGTLLTRRGKNGLPHPLCPPAGKGHSRLQIEAALEAAPGNESVVSIGDGQAASVTLRVKNLGDEPAFWLRLAQERDLGDPLVFLPPPVRGVLPPGETWATTASVSYLAPALQPQGTEGRLKVRLEQAHGDPVTLEIPVHGRAPELTLTGEPMRIEGDVPALAVKVRNAGEQELQEAEFRVRISGIDKPLARVSEDVVPAGAELALSFALPEDLELSADSRLTLEARELSFPRHDWTFADLPVRLSTPPWQLYAWLAALVLVLSVLLWYLRQYSHPLTRQLAVEPAALPRLGLAELDKARGLLKRTRRLSTVLSANGIHVRWLDRALRFRKDATEEQVKWLAQRLGAGWRRMEGLGADGAIARFELTLGEDFPLNLKTCSLVFPPGDWPEQDVLTSLGSGGDQVCLILSGNPDQQAVLSRRCRSPDNWLVAPEEGDLSALLLSPQPVDAFARLIAGYVKVARISPYQTSAGVSKESAFFGRTQVISEIQHGQPANYLLVGGRQLGKSSLLLALKRRYDLDDGVDCSYLSVGKATIESRLARALGMPSDPSLEAILERLGEVESGKRRLLLLDEADVFVQRDAGQGYGCLNGFRSLSDEGRCQFVLAGFWSLYRSAHFDYQAPIRNFAEPITIGALEPDACRDLVVKPMNPLNLRYESKGIVDRILALTGGRANLIAIICDQMLKGLSLDQRELTESDLERALESRSLRSALEGWTNLTGDGDADRLDRLIVYGLIGRDEFGLGDVLELLTGLRFEATPERVKESLTRLELAFIAGRSQNRFRWQVPLWREQVLAEEPESMLKRELDANLHLGAEEP